MSTTEKPALGQKGLSRLQVEVDRLARQKVLAGIELLKKEFGDEWVDHIDLEKLDLASGSRCILGQLYEETVAEKEFPGEGYEYAIHEVKPFKEIDPREYGFLAPHEVSWEMLDAAWTQEVYAIRESR